MDLVGIKVVHKSYGAGTVTFQDEKYIEVQFKNEIKRFTYLTKDSPFVKFMTAEDADVQTAILQRIKEVAENNAMALQKAFDDERRSKEIAAFKEKYEKEQVKKAERKEQAKKQREHDEIFGLTPTSLAMLGIIDDFYNLYESIIDLYADKTARSILLLNREENKAINIELRKLCLPVLNQHHLVFSEDDKGIHTPAYAFGSMCMHYFDVRNGGYKVKFISFRTFLIELKHAVAHVLLRRKQYLENDENANFETVNRAISQRIGTLALQQKDARRITNESVIVSDEPLYLFDSLSKTKCYREEHPVTPKSFFAKLIDGSEVVDLPTHYCEHCHRHFMGTKTLSLYEKNFGKLFVERKSASDEGTYEGFALESKLHQLGYNVVDGELSEKQRWDILTRIIESKRMSYFAICSLIEQNLQLFKNSPQHRLAVMKWEKDLRFLGDYIVTHPDL